VAHTPRLGLAEGDGGVALGMAAAVASVCIAGMGPGTSSAA
jgi:hypothetical protein